MAQRPTAASNPAAGLLGPAFLADPYRFYAMLRAAGRVFRPPVPGHDGAGVAILTHYADVEAALRDERLSANRRLSDVFLQFAGALPRQLLADPEGFASMLMMDPPDHTRLRGLVNKAFTPRRVERLRPRIAVLVDALLEEAASRGGMDVIHDFAEPLPAIVIAELLGVPAEDHRAFKTMSSRLIHRTPASLLQRGGDAAAADFEELLDYMRGIVAARRDDPRDDLISAMIEAQAERDALSEAELVSTSLLLLIAGHETTTNLIGNGLLALLRNPGELARLRADPELLENAVEELLRYDSPVQGTVRVATEDLVVGDQPVAKGALVVCLIGAANRDPEVYADPDRLDVGRRDLRHLSFGFGAHFCLGAGLARLEARTAFRALLDCFPDIRLEGVEADEVRYRPNPFLRGLEALPVSFGAAA